MKCTSHIEVIDGWWPADEHWSEPLPKRKLAQCEREIGHGGAHRIYHDGSIREWASAEGRFQAVEVSPTTAGTST